MINAVLFDLDGTLVQTERLKAEAYGLAIQRIRNLPEPETRTADYYAEVVGSTPEQVSRFLMERFDLEAELRELMPENDASEPWEVLTNMRLSIYNEMVADPQVLRDNQWPHTVGLLKAAKDQPCLTGLVTSSRRNEALHVLKSLEIESLIDVVLAAEDVEKHKPDPEVYLLAASRLAVEPQDCLVIEDSPAGVRAASAAGMNVVAVATPFTLAGLHVKEVVDHAWIVHEPTELIEVVQQRIAAHNRDHN